MKISSMNTRDKDGGRHIYACTLTLHENTFFSSREINNFYQTEALIGNYALSYAFGFAQAAYDNTQIRYKEHLGALNARGIYVTPAKAWGETHYAISQFNATAESYWSRVEQNALSNDIQIKVGKGKKARPANLPQIGFIKMLGINSLFRCYILSQQPLELPRYIRLGKFMSKAKVEATHHYVMPSEEKSDFTCTTLLNPLDLADESVLEFYDLYAVHPCPLLDNARLQQVYSYDVGDGRLPVGMRYGFGESGK